LIADLVNFLLLTKTAEFLSLFILLLHPFLLCVETIIAQHELQQGNQVFLAHLFCIEPSSHDQLSVVHQQVQLILDSFQDIFVEPTSLTPQRSIDHQIVLQSGHKPINQRPYRFFYSQKLEIEHILEDLLKHNFIQASTNPFASPVLLVRKKEGS
jgi:hypothetical protein